MILPHGWISEPRMSLIPRSGPRQTTRGQPCCPAARRAMTCNRLCLKPVPCRNRGFVKAGSSGMVLWIRPSQISGQKYRTTNVKKNEGDISTAQGTRHTGEEETQQSSRNENSSKTMRKPLKSAGVLNIQLINTTQFRWGTTRRDEKQKLLKMNVEHFLRMHQILILFYLPNFSWNPLRQFSEKILFSVGKSIFSQPRFHHLSRISSIRAPFFSSFIHEKW